MGRGRGNTTAALLCVGVVVVMVAGQALPALRDVQVAVWGASLVLLVTALVVVVRTRRRADR